jgi:hypothetical protein
MTCRVEESPYLIWTNTDANTFTHILYLNTVPSEIFNCRLKKLGGSQFMPLARINQWQEIERRHLRDICRKNGILLAILNYSPTLVDRTHTLVRDFSIHKEEMNLARIKWQLKSRKEFERHSTVLVIEADKTLTPLDTTELFWERYSSNGSRLEEGSSLNTIFGSELGYSYLAFRQAMLLIRGKDGQCGIPPSM